MPGRMLDQSIEWGGRRNLPGLDEQVCRNIVRVCHCAVSRVDGRNFGVGGEEQKVGAERCWWWLMADVGGSLVTSCGLIWLKATPHQTDRQEERSSSRTRLKRNFQPFGLLWSYQIRNRHTHTESHECATATERHEREDKLSKYDKDDEIESTLFFFDDKNFYEMEEINLKWKVWNCEKRDFSLEEIKNQSNKKLYKNEIHLITLCPRSDWEGRHTHTWMKLDSNE